MKLGRLPHDPAQVAALPSLRNYLGSSAAMPSSDWTRDIAPNSWRMFDNDTLSDCGPAAACHAIMTWGSYKPPFRIPTDQDAIGLYSAVGSYVPGRPETDQGVRLLDLLRYWLAHGFAGEPLSAFCVVDPRNRAHVRMAIDIFGGLYAGVTLRQAQLDDPGPWRVTATPIVGGHGVWVGAANDDGLLGITWGEVRPIDWDFWEQATDEAYALLSPRWTEGGVTPSGFQVAAMIADMPVLAV